MKCIVRTFSFVPFIRTAGSVSRSRHSPVSPYLYRLFVSRYFLGEMPVKCLKYLLKYEMFSKPSSTAIPLIVLSRLCNCVSISFIAYSVMISSAVFPLTFLHITDRYFEVTFSFSA